MRAQLLLGLVEAGHAGFGAANGLDDERDDVACAKHNRVPFGRQEGGLAAEVDDEAAEEDVQCGREEDGRDDEGDFLGEEAVGVVGAFGRVGAGCPSY